MNLNNQIDSTAYLQSLLDQRGEVKIPGGVYTISQTLIIYDNTKLSLAFDAVIRLADGANCVMLRNQACQTTGKNRNILVEGGTWDGNNRGQAPDTKPEGKPYYFGVILRFQEVEDLTIRDVTVKDPCRYAMQIMHADRFTVDNITFDYNMYQKCMDGVHVQGWARNGMIRNIKGATNDDLVALNCDDYYDDGEKRSISQGDIENVVVDGLYADNGYTAVRLLSCGSRMRNVKIRNVFGTYRLYGVSFTQHDIVPGAPVWFDNIDIDGIYCAKQPQDPPVDPKFINGIDNYYSKGSHDRNIRRSPIIWFARGVTCGNVSIVNVHRDEETVTEANTIKIDPNVRIEKLLLQNITQRFHNCPEVPLIRNEGDVENLIELA
ncbi:MAG: hypothetical protein IJY47_03340 [Clostridia bacterium]|nr:hypothetical protein [Clostridia bacterium]